MNPNVSKVLKSVIISGFLIVLLTFCGYAEESAEVLEEAEEFEVIETVLGLIGLIVGIIACVFGFMLARLVRGTKFEKGNYFIVIGTFILGISSISCFFGYISGLYSEDVSIFIEDQLRLMALVFYSVGLYLIYRNFKM